MAPPAAFHRVEAKYHRGGRNLAEVEPMARHLIALRREIAEDSFHVEAAMSSYPTMCNTAWNSRPSTRRILLTRRPKRLANGASLHES